MVLVLKMEVFKKEMIAEEMTQDDSVNNEVFRCLLR